MNMENNQTNHKDQIIEYLFKNKSNLDCFSSYVTDELGNKIGYLNLDNGNQVACYQANNKSPVIELEVNGYKVLYIKNYKKGNAARKVIMENGVLLIYIYNEAFEIIEMYEKNL